MQSGRYARRSWPQSSYLQAILRLCAAFALLGGTGITAVHAGEVPSAHGIAMHGALKMPADFKHFSYVNPDAPKGGRLRLAAFGSFDSLNPLIVRGEKAAGVRGNVYESLLARSLEEPFALYGLLAESLRVADDRSWIAFTLNPKAQFSDGEPVTIEDVIFSHELLKKRGRPNHRTFYKKVTSVDQTGPRTVRFTFESDVDREMALIMGLMPVVPKHRVDPETFEKTTLTPLVGSGPYVIADLEPGVHITYRRNPEYWGRDLPVNRGRHNFDSIRYDYYRDANAMQEAFARGLYDVRYEGDPDRWSLGYDYPAVERGDIVKATFPVRVPSGMSGLLFNTRKGVFSDLRVRKALVGLFDFEWLNRKFYHGLYVRTQSYFDRSELASHGVAADQRERALLASFKTAVAPDILEGRHSFPKTDGSGRNRKAVRDALKLLRSAGYKLEGRVLRHEASGQPFRFEILAVSSEQERLLLSYARILKQAGIEATIRVVDSTQYQRRRTNFDFDMIQWRYGASLSPGNEQLFRWSSDKADVEGSWNLSGARNPAIDAMIAALLKARTRDEFISAVRAYDRVLLSGHYLIPLFHLPEQWVAHWKHLRYPKATSLYGYQVDTWWHGDAEKK